MNSHLPLLKKGGLVVVDNYFFKLMGMYHFSQLLREGPLLANLLESFMVLT